MGQRRLHFPDSFAAQKTTLPSVLSRWDSNLRCLAAVRRLRLLEAFATNQENYVSQKSLRLRDRKRRVRRVSLRAVPSNYGVQNVATDEVRGPVVSDRPRKSPPAESPPPVLLPTCSSFPIVSGGLHGETEVQAGRGIPQVA